MRIFLQTSWFLLPYFWAVADSAGTDSGVVEVDVVFPRNDTYAPNGWMPIIFTFQNKGLAPFLNPTISFIVRNIANDSDGHVGEYSFLRWANYTDSEPVLLYRFFDLDKEASWVLMYEITWQSCTNETLSPLTSGDDVVTNITDNFIEFTTKAGAQELNLAAITASDNNCPAAAGVAINVTGTLEAVNDWTGRCAVVASPDPTVTPDPCQASINSAAEASISASMTAWACLYDEISPPPGIICPAKDAAQQMVVGAVVCLAVGLGAFLHILL